MSFARGQRLKIRLFVEGIEIPIIAASVQASPNSPTVASLQIPPLAEGTRFLPRTLIHLFFLDFYGTEGNPHISNRGDSKSRDARDPDLYEQELLKQNTEEYNEKFNRFADEEESALVSSHYKLMFAGEVVGIQWTKREDQRSLVLQCMDFSNYWDFAYQYGNQGLFGPGIKAIFSGGAHNLFTDILQMDTKGSVVSNIISSGRCNTFPKMKGLCAGVIRLIEAISGSFNPPRGAKNRKKYAGQNIFFSLAELRLHITHLVGALENDPTSSRLIRRGGYTAMFNRMLGGMGGQTSIRQCLNAIAKTMFYEMYAQPCPMYVPGRVTTGGEVETVVQTLGENPVTKFIVSDAKKQITALNGAKEVLATLTLDYLTQELGEKVVVEPKESVLASKKKVFILLEQTRRSIRKTHSQVRGAHMTQIKSAMSRASSSVGKAKSILYKWRPSSSNPLLSLPQKNIDKAIEALTQLSQGKVKVPLISSENPPRLLQQIFRPDIWFGSPPRCNVLFPDNYTSLTYERHFLQEPTRFMLKTVDEFWGDFFLFNNYYFAPQSPSIKQNKAKLRKMLKNDLLDHELFTGVLPVFEKMGEFNIFAGRAEAAKSVIDKQKEKGKKPKPTRRRNPHAKSGFAQRSTNFLYFKHRYNARTMDITGPFNPYIACGFPGLVIDKYVDGETIALYNKIKNEEADIVRAASKDIRIGGVVVVAATPAVDVLGTNFLGSFNSVRHNISQMDAKGETIIRAQYARQVEETVEFLGLDLEGTVRKKFDAESQRSTDVACLFPPKLYSLGPNFGQIVSVEDVSKMYFFGGKKEGAKLPIFLGTRRSGPDKSPPRIAISTPTLTDDINSILIDTYGKEVGVGVTVVFKAYRITEEVPSYRRIIIEEPIEEKIRPGWYGEVWSPSKIGEAYHEFFRTGAITDPQQIADPDGASTGATSEDASDALTEKSKHEQGYGDHFEGLGTAFKAEAPAIVSLEEGATIKQAVEFLHLTYSYIKQNRLDVDEFIRSYTWRPIATMIDIFGTSDLEFSDDGSEVTRGIEGFHSRAFGPYDDLFSMVGPDLLNIAGVKKDTPIAQRADVRGRRYRLVQQYVAVLKYGRGILG